MESTENAKSQAEKPNKNRSVLWIAPAVLVIVVIVLVMMFGNLGEPAATLLKLSPRQGDVYVSSIGMKLVYIPAGEYMMGSNDGDDEKPIHKVKTSQGFYMGVHEISRRQFEQFVKKTGYRTDAERKGWSYAWRGSSPAEVDGLSWQNPGYKQTDVVRRTDTKQPTFSGRFHIWRSGTQIRHGPCVRRWLFSSYPSHLCPNLKSGTLKIHIKMSEK
ncbi:formylglycine-generating enzyme family protein [Planctomycetota bacterium]